MNYSSLFLSSSAATSQMSGTIIVSYKLLFLSDSNNSNDNIARIFYNKVCLLFRCVLKKLYTNLKIYLYSKFLKK